MANRNFRYSPSSKAKLSTGSTALQKVAERAMEVANTRKAPCPDFGVSSVKRTEKEQFELFKTGRVLNNGKWVIEDTNEVLTYSDGKGKKSVHQSGDALDFFASIGRKANYDQGNIAIIAGCFMQAANELGYKFRWGGNFQSISDGGHFELVLNA